MAELEKRKQVTAAERNLIDNIKRWRLEREFTQERLSVEIGKNENYISKVESYGRSISLKTMFKIAQVLKVKPRDLFD